MTWDFKPGDRVRVGGGFFGAFWYGTLISKNKKFGRPSWLVKLDKPMFLRREVNAWESNLTPAPSSKEWLARGRKVVIADRPMKGITGTLVRPARLLWKRAWLVELDQPFGGLKRTRVAEELLLPRSD